ncbi:hypothetical protein [Caballeronia sp. 15711]|uniref:hypothetical protein n=1 Tax=Caballeronia sp. 15711 TaxID=3391029 RepID=UPI0039E63216
MALTLPKGHTSERTRARTTTVSKPTRAEARDEHGSRDALTRRMLGQMVARTTVLPMRESDPSAWSAHQRDLTDHLDSEVRALSAKLGQLGLDPDVVGLLGKIIDASVTRQVVDLLDAARQGADILPHGGDTTLITAEMLPAGEFGRRINVSDETVRQRERDGHLFSVLPAGRARGRLYPVFQLLPGVTGKPLDAVISRLGDVGGASIYQFLSSGSEAFAGLSPLQVLIRERDVREESTTVMDLSDEQRLEAVLRAANGFLAELNA